MKELAVGKTQDTGDMHTQRKLCIDAWQARDSLFQGLFGNYAHVWPDNYAPPKLTLPTSQTKADSGGSGDPGGQDQRLAILAYSPDPLRPYWSYVTCGLSTPWYQEKPLEVSGFGLEIVLKTPTAALWPQQLLCSMAFYLFNHAGTFSPGVRIALNSPSTVHLTDSALQNIFIWYADEAPDCWYQLPSGGFGVFAAIGITADELRFAESVEQYGTWCIQEVLRQTGIGQITDPTRKSVMTYHNINNILQSVKSYADNFRQNS